MAYLDDNGEPIAAGPEVKLPEGYSLLSTKKADKPKSTVKELKAKAEKVKPVVPPKGYIIPAPADYTSNPKNEGLYEMFGRIGQGDAVGNISVPYSKVQSYLDSGGTFQGNTGSQERYAKDKDAAGKTLGFWGRVDEHINNALQPVHEDPNKPQPISNTDRAVGRTLYAAPKYLWSLAKQIKIDHDTGSMEAMKMMDPAQIPTGLYDQWKADWATGDHKLAMDNLLGSLVGLGIVGAATHGAAKTVGKGFNTLTDKLSPVTEIPDRVKTNVLHRNAAGEVRQAKGQAPTVWLSPSAWQSFMGALYPGEDAVATNGVNLPTNEHLHAFANDPELAAQNPAFAHVQELLGKAHENANKGGVAIAKQRPSIQSNVNVMREELNHTWQRSLANGKVNSHLSPEAFTDLHQSIPKGMVDHLVEQGYDETSAPEMVTETAAKLMDGHPERFGVTPDEAVDFLDKYFKQVSNQHGTKALEALQHVRGIAAEAKTRAIGEHSGTGGGQDNGIIPSMAAGGQEGSKEGVPVFNREKPTWYLKSERLIGEKMKGPQPAEDVQKMLIAGGIKPEEMEWTGIDDFLKSKGKEKVTPEEIREYLADNNIRMEEVTKGDGLTAAEADRHKELLSKVFKSMSQEESNELNSLSQKNSSYSPTKYGFHVLLGGQNYREMLLTMPERRFTNDEMIEALAGKRPISDAFKSNHWDEPNILAHVRFNDRTGPNGEKLLHVEEVQSDWHQKGRDKGYTSDKARKESLNKTKKLYSEARDIIDAKVDRLGYSSIVGAMHAVESHPDWVDRWDARSSLTPEEIAKVQEWKEAKAERDRIHSGAAVPEAPFKKTWHEMVLRRILKMATDKGYDGVSWTGGEDQNSRYNLSKHVEKIVVPGVNPDGSRSVRIDPIGGGHDSFNMMVAADGTVEGYYGAGQFTGKKLDEVVGKDIAKKIMDIPYFNVSGLKDGDNVTVQRNGEEVEAVAHPERRLNKGKPTESIMVTSTDGKEVNWFVPLYEFNSRSFSGKGLEVGGSGMKGFYDKIVPDYLNKFGKKFGAKVDETTVNSEQHSDTAHRRFAVINPNGEVAMQYPTRAEAEAHAERRRGQNIGRWPAGSNWKVRDDYPENDKKVQYLPITPEMRKSVGEEGVPLFNREQVKTSDALESDAWERIAQELGSKGKTYNRDIEEALKAEGLPHNKGTQAFTAVSKRAREIGEQRAKALREERLTQRKASPEYLESEQELKDAYGDEWDEMTEEERHDAVESDLDRKDEEREEEEQKQRGSEEYDRQLEKKVAYMDDKQKAVEDELTKRGFTFSSKGRYNSSRYITVDSPDEDGMPTTIRISDHEPAVGIRGGAVGGFNVVTGDRHDAADLSFHPGEDDISRLDDVLPDNPSAEQDAPTDLDVNTNMEGDSADNAAPIAEQKEQAGTGTTGSTPNAILPIGGGTVLASAPIQNIPGARPKSSEQHTTERSVTVPLQTALGDHTVQTKQVLPLAQIKAMAAHRNPQPQVGSSARDLMKQAKERMGNTIVP